MICVFTLQSVVWFTVGNGYYAFFGFIVCGMNVKFTILFQLTVWKIVTVHCCGRGSTFCSVYGFFSFQRSRFWQSLSLIVLQSLAPPAPLYTLKPNTHRRRRRDETVLSRRVGVGGVYMNSRRLPTDSSMHANAQRSRRP